MGVTDWERISKIHLDELNSMSSDDVDIIYELMANIDDINNVQEAEKLHKAFNVSQFIMSYKAEECKSVSEELDEAYVEIKKLKVMKEELEKENAALQRSDGADIDVVREKRNWEMERDSMSQEIHDLKSKYNSLTEANEAKEERLSKQSKELEALQEANSKLNENIEFLRQRATQLKSQKDSSQDTNKSELAYIRSELRQKKIDLDNAQDRAVRLHEQIDELTANLEAATNEIERLTQDYRHMKSNCGATDGELQNAEAECKMLRLQMEELREQMGDKVEMDDRVMAHVNEQVQKWKQIMDERDSEICRLYEDNAKLRQEVQRCGINTEKASVQALIKLVKEREHDVEELTKQLVEATSAIEENTELIANLKKDLDRTGGGSAGHQMRRIKELRQMLDDKERRIKETVSRLEQVEAQTADREHELTEALERNKMYEKGEFGLSEAVGEIKAVKAQLAVKERQLEQMCQELNKVGYSLEEMRFENGHLRTQLGIPVTEQLDIEGYRRQKAAQDEEERAINIVLQKEVEKLEDERLVMKKKIRTLARQAGLRAGSAGLEAGDVMDEFCSLDLQDTMLRNTEDRAGGTRALPANRGESGATSRTWQIREKEMSRELLQAVRDAEKREGELARLGARNSQLETEHDAMRDALRQLQDEWHRISASPAGAGGKGGLVVECPVLDKLLVALETRKLVGEFDSGLYLKAKLDNLAGRNEELRLELRNARVDTQKSQLECERLRQRLRVLGPSLDGGDGADGADEPGQLLGLPEPLSATAAQTIAALNQHLVLVLQDKALKEHALDKADCALDQYRRKFALVRHQQGLLYRQYADEKQRSEAELDALRARVRDLEGARTEDAARITEFTRLLDGLALDETGLKQRLAELTRDVTVLKVNECALTRRYVTVQEMEQTLRRENNKLKNEMIQIEGVVTDRMGYYRRFKETANYKLNVLQKDLDESVPKRDLDKLQIKFDELTEKYRNFLEKQNILIGRGESIVQIESELTKMKMDHEALKKILEAEKQRRHVLEATLEAIGEESVSNTSQRSTTGSPRKARTGGVNEAHLISISKKVTTLEMKEINERERADHAVRMYDSIKSTWGQAEKRNKELEEKLGQLTSSNLELQKIERELRDELADSVTKEVSEHDKARLLELERREMAAKHEIEQLKEIAEIATMQASTLQQQQVSREKELASLRAQLLDVQSQSDAQSAMGRLHRHVVQLQLSEAAALRKLDDAQRVQKRLECELLRTERACDDKDQGLYHSRLQARARAKHLKDTINSLRERFSGCVPLARQERFTGTLVRLTEEKARLDGELQRTICAKFELETQFESLKLVREGERELKEAAQHRKREKDVLELWSKKMEQARLDCFRHKRQTDLLRHELEHLESVIMCQESQLAQVDEDMARLNRAHDEKELGWEQRENELERIIYNFENIQGEVIVAAHSFQEASGRKDYFGTMPDASAPLPNQLEQAVATIKKNIRVIFDKENENKSLRKQVQEHDSKVRELEGTLLKRERYINELRLRLPATEEREDQMKRISEAASATLLGEHGTGGGGGSGVPGNYADEKTMWAAQKTLASLQERLRAKDESVQRYEKLLKEAREDLVACNQRHAEEMQLVRERVQPHTARRLELAAHPLPLENQLTSDQLRENNELRDLLVIQTRTSEDLRFQLGELQRLLMAERLKAETNEKIHQSRVKEADVRIESDLLDLRENVNNLKNKLGAKESQIEFQSAEIARLKADALRSPSAEMKGAFGRLGEQLKEKERQLVVLKKNLAEVKKTVADQSIDALRLTRDEMVKQESVQKMLDKHTRDLSNELEANRDQVLQYQRELRASRADRDRLQLELDGVKADAEHKDAQWRKFKADRNKLEQENEDLRGQLQRIKNLRNLSSNDALKQELESTKMRLHLIEEENAGLKKTAAVSEKPQPVVAKASQQEGKLAAWEEGKKSQKVQDKMREKLAEKESEVANLGRQLDTTTKALDRLRREKQVLETRLTDKWGPGALLDVAEDAERLIGPAHARKTQAVPSSSPGADGVEELKRKNMELEREINRLCRADVGHRDSREPSAVTAVNLKEAEMRNRLLQKNIDDLERRVVKSGNATVINLEKERAMQNEIIRLNGENLALKFEVDSSRKELPRLKEKVSELKKYAELLRAEKEALEARATSVSQELSASTISNIRKIGESGKSSKELEKVISRMKKVVEKTQLENERLKSAPGVVLGERTALLQAENAELRRDLAEVRAQVGQRLADRYDAKERGVLKMAEDYERLRKELLQERAEHDGTRDELKQLARELEKRDKRTAELESKLAIAESRTRFGGGRGEASELQEENRRLKQSVGELQEQLADRRRQNADLSRLDELKYRYQVANERNSLLERQLKNFSEQFGVSVDLG